MQTKTHNGAWCNIRQYFRACVSFCLSCTLYLTWNGVAFISDWRAVVRLMIILFHSCLTSFELLFNFRTYFLIYDFLGCKTRMFYYLRGQRDTWWTVRRIDTVYLSSTANHSTKVPSAKCKNWIWCGTIRDGVSGSRIATGRTGVRPAGLTLRFMQRIPLMIEDSTVW